MDDVVDKIREAADAMNDGLIKLDGDSHAGIIYEITIAWLLRYKQDPAKQRRMLDCHVDGLENLFKG